MYGAVCPRQTRTHTKTATCKRLRKSFSAAQLAKRSPLPLPLPFFCLFHSITTNINLMYNPLFDTGRSISVAAIYLFRLILIIPTRFPPYTVPHRHILPLYDNYCSWIKYLPFPSINTHTTTKTYIRNK